MRNLNGVWVIVSLLFAWFFSSSAFAQGQTLYEGEHFLYAKCPNPDGKKRCIRLINQRGNPVDAQSLAEKFGIDAFQLRAQNPQSTIAVCRDPTRRNVWHMARIERAEDRVTNIIWAQCPESDRRVVTVPGEIFQIDTDNQLPTFTSVEGAVRAASQCGVKNPDCVRKAIQSVVPINDDGGASSSSLTAPQPQSPPASPPPPANSPPPTLNNGGPPSAVSHTSSSSPAVVKTSLSGEYAFALWAMLAILILSSLLTIWTLYQKGKLEKANKKLHSDLDDESNEKVGLKARITQLEQGGESFTQQVANLERQYDDSLTEKSDSYQRLMTEKQREVERLQRYISRLATIYAKDQDPKQISVEMLIGSIEQHMVSEIVQQAVLHYGQDLVDRLEMPKTRNGAWVLLTEAENSWHRQYLETISSLQSLLTTNPSSFGADPTGFLALKQVGLDIELCRRSVCEELERTGTSFSSSDDLLSLLGTFVSVHVHLQGELESTRKMAEVYKQGQLSALRAARTSSEEEPEPASKPSNTATGLGAPTPPPTTERGSSPMASSLRLVSNGGHSDGKP